MSFIKNLSAISVSAAMLFSATSCVAVTGGDAAISGHEQIAGSGKIVTQEVPVSSDFTELSVPSIIDVIVTQGNTNSIKIVGSDNLIKYCDASVSGKTLNIGMTKEAENINFKKFDVKVYVTAKTLNKVDVSGTGDVDFKGNFNTSKFEIDITGTGDVTVPSVTATNFNVSIAGTGDVKAKGSCDNASLSITGTGDINAELTGLKTLDASISGTGDIELGGSTVKANYSVSGTGDIEAKDMKASVVTASSTGTGDIECYASESFSGSKSTTAGLKCYGDPAKYDMKKN